VWGNDLVRGISVNAVVAVRPTLEPSEAALPLLDRSAVAFLVSFVLHLSIVIALGLWPIAKEPEEAAIVVSSTPIEEMAELKLPEEFVFSELPTQEIGSNSVQGQAAALSMAPVISEVAAIPNRLDVMPVENARIEINELSLAATGLHYAENLAVKGAAGEGTTGAAGAIDRITHEILLSLEERRTLVVWLFDQTASIVPQRETIRDRFNKIYKELGVVEAAGNETFVKHEAQPLLSSVVGFGSGVKYMTKKPTDSLAELKQAVMEVPNDDSGTENVFSAVFDVAKRYAEYRYAAGESGEPDRNVMIVVFTDEAGTDTQRAEDTIKMCRRWAMPVYVIGVPAPFGRKETQMKWVDPDPKYDQSPQWGLVEQGPESLLPERIKLSFAGSNEDDLPLDSGFGPYALTRLCSETGGIYFAVHPNRKVNRFVSRGETAQFASHLSHFFDPEVMRRYRPEYVSINEYQKRVSENKARTALVQAATSSAKLTSLENPRLRFVKQDEAEFARELSTAQQAAAALEPKVNAIYQVLQQGENDRDSETVARWQAGYDLAMGRILAVKVRTETYNAMLAAAKRGLKPSDLKNNTWVLQPSDEVSVGSQYAKLAERARMYLNRVVREHPDTPWATLAQRELKDPIGWRWKDSYTDLAAKAKMVANNAKARPQNDQKKMLPKGPPKRPPPKL
jgi:hypothetical protein